MIRRFASAAAMVAALGLTAACQSAEEQAQGKFDSALEWVEKGEVDRALIELRNVFKLDGRHREARRTYARLVAERGNLQEAASQYLLLVEQYPDDLDGRSALARLALMSGNWDVAAQQVAAVDAAGIGADDPVLKSVRVSLAYREALRDDRTADVEQAVAEAAALMTGGGDPVIARRVVIDDMLRRNDWADALAVIDAGLADTPGDRDLLDVRLAVLGELGRLDDAEAQLRTMLDMFPDDPAIAQNLLGLLEGTERIDEAMTLLQARLDPAEPETVRQLVSFIVRHRGPEAGLAEVDRLIATAPENLNILRATRAGLIFDMGNPDAGISEMQSVLETASPSDETRRMKVSLAYMYQATGGLEKARALVEEVLAEDRTQEQALKLRAGWLIDEDRPGDALVDLRAALDQAPRDPQIMTLMARAHERAGNVELVGDMLSRAVEVSNNSPDEALLYSDFLMRSDKLQPAEDVLLSALRQQPGDVRLLQALGTVYVLMEDWPRLELVVGALEQLGTDQGTAIANELTARELAARSQTDELGGFLEGLAAQDPENLGVQIELMRQDLAKGDTARVLQRAQDLATQFPDRLEPRLIVASVHAGEGNFDAAMALLATLREEFPRDERVYMTLYNVAMLEGDETAAREALDVGLDAIPDSTQLLWARAGQLEATGDVEGAIAAYETWYGRDPGSVIAANNLASLLADHRESSDDLARAFTIARRLRGTEEPAFQATYGWILVRVGNHEEALDYLVSAAEAFPENAKVQYHLAEAYVGLGRDAEALAAYEKAVALLEGTEKPAYWPRIEAEVARLTAEVPVDDAAPADAAE